MEPVDKLFAEFAALVPKCDYPCSLGCGEMHGAQGKPCWTCQRRLDFDTDARDVARQSELTLPAGFECGRLDASELRVLVGTAILDAAHAAIGCNRVTLAGKGSGVGKTTLAVAMFREWVTRNRGKRALWLSAYTVAGKFEVEPEWLDCELLVIDDLGNEQMMANSPIAALLDARHRRGLWITTPHTNETQIANHYGGKHHHRAQDAFNIARRVFQRAVVIDFGKGAR